MFRKSRITLARILTLGIVLFLIFFLSTNITGLTASSISVWISSYTHKALATRSSNHLGLSTITPSPTLSLAPTPQLSFLVSGSVNRTNITGNFDSIYEIELYPSIPTTGKYTLRFEDVTGHEIASYNFDADFIEDTDRGIFSLVLPRFSNTANIVLLDGTDVLDKRSASDHAPTVRVTFPNGGENLSGTTTTLSWSASDADNDKLEYVVQYSKDGGSSWETLAASWPNTTLEVDPSLLAGTESGLIRVLASDVFYTSQDQSDAIFSVEDHAPEIEIYMEDGDTFAGDQTVILEGAGYDLQDGELSGQSLEWSSSIDGILGQGESLAINAQDLSEGTHTITLAATNSRQQTSTASITIYIYRFFSNLMVTPTTLDFISYENTSHIVSIQHLGNHSVNWSATANQSWIKLQITEGDTPASLVVFVDPTGLALGTYHGAITITSDAENDGQQILPVILQVQDMPPLVDRIITSDPNPTNLTSVNFTVVFSEPVSGVDVSDFTIDTTGTLSDVVISAVSGSGRTYTVTVSYTHGSGTIHLNLIDNDSIVDEANNSLGCCGADDGSFPYGETYTITATK